MIAIARLLLLFSFIIVIGCSNDDGGCDTGGGTPLAASAWPKFRGDLANTGRSNGIVAATHGERWRFPREDAPPLANAVTSPVIMEDGRILVVGGQSQFPTVNRAYLIDPMTGDEDDRFDVPLNNTAGVSSGSTPVISQSRIGIMFADTTVRQFEFDGDFVGSFPASGVVTGSLTLDFEGTIYTATTGGAYSSLCASGGARYLLGIGGTESSPALFEGDPMTNDDDVSVIGSNDGKVRAFEFFGEARWTFTATSAVRASVIYDIANSLVYGVDDSGFVFAVQAADGRRCRNLSVNLGTPVLASPALGEGVLYVIGRNGVLHALGIEAACDTGSSAPDGLVERWRYISGASASSSPALASSPDGEPVIVFGSDDGTVHAVVDQGASGTTLWTHCTEEGGAFGRSSPAIGADGTVYVTTAANRLYAIGAGTAPSMPCPATDVATPTASPSASSSPTPTETAQP